MSLAAYQIVYIEKGETRLYGELVQQIEDRNTCWFRPLSLRLREPKSGEWHLLNVGNGPDIICAGDQIQPVLDTEWINLQADMAKDYRECDFSEANQHLRHFLTDLLSP